MQTSRSYFLFLAALVAPAGTAQGVSTYASPSGAGCQVLATDDSGCAYARSSGLAELSALVPSREGVVIASVSSGIDFRVASLSSAVVLNGGETGQGREDNGVDDDGNGYVDDPYGFDVLGDSILPSDSKLGLGTFSSSVWLGEKRDDTGDLVFAGFVRGAGLIPVRVLSASGLTSLEATMKGLRYASARGARVIHLEVSLQSSAGEPLCEVIREVGRSAPGRRSALVVAPAGNTGFEVGPRSYPAACEADNLVVVAATDSTGALARFSSFGGARVHVAAPGVDVAGLDRGGELTMRTGTGSAAALVTAAAALLAAARPEDSAQVLKKRLVLGADDNPNLYGKVLSQGSLNAMKAYTTKEL
jgi:thermitase